MLALCAGASVPKYVHERYKSSPMEAMKYKYPMAANRLVTMVGLDRMADEFLITVWHGIIA